MRAAASLLIAVLTCISFGCSGGGNSTPITPPPPPPPGGSVPTLVQHVTTATNFDPGQLGSPYFINLPNRTGANNALILGISYVGINRVVTIRDDKNNAWQLGTSTNDGQRTTAVYYSLSILGGTQKITASFDTAVYDFQAMASEFYNVALSNALDGSTNGTGTAPAISTGTMNTTSSGDLIYSYAFDTNVNDTVTGFTADTNATLLGADIQRGLVAQYSVQSQAGSIVPKFTVSGGSNSFNVVAIALKSASAGTAPTGIRIVHVYHVLYTRPGTRLQFPATGNLLLCASAFTPLQTDITSMSTSPANSWTKAIPSQADGYPQIWYAANATTNANMQIAPILNSTEISLVCYDVAGAATAPFDSVAGLPTNFVSNTNNSPLTGIPVLTPSTANGLVFAFMNNGLGPTVGFSNPNYVLDTITYGGEIDRDAMDNADGYAHYFNPSTAPVSFDWLMNSSQLPETSAGVAIAFKGSGN